MHMRDDTNDLIDPMSLPFDTNHASPIGLLSQPVSRRLSA